MISIDRQIFRGISQIIYSHENGDVDLNTNLTDLDSLDKVECIMKLEDTFKIHITDDFAEEFLPKLETVRDIKIMLREKYNIFDIKDDRKEKLIEINNL